MWMKFEDCVKPTLGERGTHTLFEAIQGLDRMNSIAGFGLFPAGQRAASAA
jgi:hypothetical protein